MTSAIDQIFPLSFPESPPKRRVLLGQKRKSPPALERSEDSTPPHAKNTKNGFAEGGLSNKNRRVTSLSRPLFSTPPFLLDPSKAIKARPISSTLPSTVKRSLPSLSIPKTGTPITEIDELTGVFNQWALKEGSPLLLSEDHKATAAHPDPLVSASEIHNRCLRSNK